MNWKHLFQSFIFTTIISTIFWLAYGAVEKSIAPKKPRGIEATVIDMWYEPAQKVTRIKKQFACDSYDENGDCRNKVVKEITYTIEIDQSWMVVYSEFPCNYSFTLRVSAEDYRATNVGDVESMDAKPTCTN